MADTVPMLAPDGTPGDIPRERMPDAVKAGFKLGTELTSPDGRLGLVPMDRVHDAINAGFMLKGASSGSPKPVDPMQGVRGYDAMGPVPDNAMTRIGARIKQNFDIPAQVKGASQAISAGIENIRTGGPSKMPEFLDALKQYKNPENVIADIISGYVAAGAPDMPALSGAKPPGWWKSTAPEAAPPSGSGVATAIKVGKMIPGASHVAHLADFVHGLMTKSEAPAATPAPTAPAYTGPTGPPAEWGKSIENIIDSKIPPTGESKGANLQTKSKVDFYLKKGDVESAQKALDKAAPAGEPDTEFIRRRVPEAQPTPPRQAMPDRLGTPEEEARFRESFEKRGAAKKALENTTPSNFPPEGPGPYKSVADLRPKKAPTAPDQLEDHAIQQQMAQDLESHGQKAESEARREFIARNSIDTTKGELIRKSRVAKPPEGTTVPQTSEEMTQALQKTLRMEHLKQELNNLGGEKNAGYSSNKVISNGITYEYRGGQFFKNGKVLETGGDIADAIDALEAQPHQKVIEGVLKDIKKRKGNQPSK